MKVKKGELVHIIGDVGSGKSSLLQSLIGDLIYIENPEKDQKMEIKNHLKSKEYAIKLNGTISFVQ